MNTTKKETKKTEPKPELKPWATGWTYKKRPKHGGLIRRKKAIKDD